MQLVEFIQRISQKVEETNIPPVMERHLIIQNDKKTILDALYVCGQCLNNWNGKKYDEHFHSSWKQAVGLIKQHSPEFFDEFKGETEARDQLALILKRPEGYGLNKNTFKPREGDYIPGTAAEVKEFILRGRRKR